LPVPKTLLRTLKNHPRFDWLMLVVILGGVGARLWVAHRGHNYDFDSFWIVANIVDRGGNVYASTSRYNYGPIWFHVLHFLFQVAAKNVVAFRYFLVVFLSFVDLAIFVILYHRFNRSVASVFFLNPITIMITGYHNQFDNLALLIGMFAVILMGEANFDKSLTKRKLLGILMLGLSLVTKHLLFAFPLWLAVKHKGLFQKIVILGVPPLIFALSFVPYWPAGAPGILRNVFLYKSFNNAYFYRLFVPQGVQAFFTSTMVWIALLIIFAILFQPVKSFDSLLLYTCILVATSPALTNQYLAIVVPFVAANLNPFTLSYSLAGTYFLLTDSNGLHIYDKTPNFRLTFSHIFYPVLVVLLCLGLIRSRWFGLLLALIKRIWSKVKIQVGDKKRA
jgi:hypothetical protein